MSRSYKKHAFLKDRPRNYKISSFYWKIVRHVTNQKVKNGEEFLPLPQEIFNDYNYCDYRWIKKDKKQFRK